MIKRDPRHGRNVQPRFTDPHRNRQVAVHCVLAQMAGMHPDQILDNMSLRCDLGLQPSDVCGVLREHFSFVNDWLIHDPAAIVHDVEEAVEI